MGPYHDWITIPTLVCSSMSALATGTVIMMWIQSSNKDKWSFRYMLIMNLTVAEFINSWNNTLSGFTVISTRTWLTDGTTCDLNGFIGQISVQAADFSVLAIAVTTLLTVHFNTWVLKSSRYEQYLVCVATWLIPLATATIALATDNYAPVSGNWCWIRRDPTYLRYVLGHGFRFAIFVAVIAIYASIFSSVRGRLARRRDSDALNPRYSFSMYAEDAADVNVSMIHDELVRGKVTMPTKVREAVTRSSSARNKETGLEAAQDAKLDAQRRLGVKPRIRVMPSSALDRDMKHWLMLSLFPLAYIVVWLPGIANRFVEMFGFELDALTAVQATTQLTGLVNSLVYGFREHRMLHRRQDVVREMMHTKSMDLDV